MIVPAISVKTDSMMRMIRCHEANIDSISIVVVSNFELNRCASLNLMKHDRQQFVNFELQVRICLSSAKSFHELNKHGEQLYRE